MNSPRQVVWMVGLSAMVTLLWVSGAAQARSHLQSRFAHVVDLTHALDESTPYIPVPNITFPFKKTPIATVAKNGVAAYRWEIHEHLGRRSTRRITSSSRDARSNACQSRVLWRRSWSSMCRAGPNPALTRR